MNSGNWQTVLPGVARFRDSCNVYALTGPAGTLIIDAGSGNWLKHLNELPSPPIAVLCTHYFRDHSAGASAAAAGGIACHVPEGERAIFTDPAEHFRQRETFIIYDNVWDLFAPISPTPVAGILRDYDKIQLAGLTIEIIPLPGATVTQIGLGVTLGDGRRIIFCGEAIAAPGKMARLAPLQYNYNDFPGAMQAHFAAQTLRSHKPAALLPSLGELILSDVDAALALLQENLLAHCRKRANMNPLLARLGLPPLIRITDHVWRDNFSSANTTYLLGKSGRVMAIDYGYHSLASGFPEYARPHHRRALLHGLDALKDQFGIDRIDTVLVSHFHDDHVCGIPVLQRLFGTECWVAESFADLLQHPEAHCFPCNWPTPIKVNRRLALGQTFQWEQFTFRLHPMSGHTRFSSLIGFEADGKRFAHTGDQYFFETASWTEPFEITPQTQRFHNWVYRNGALLNGFAQSGNWLLDFRPDIVLQGHQAPFITNDAFFTHIKQWTHEYEDLHRTTMLLDDDQPHFNLDSWGGWIWPYRVHQKSRAAAAATVRVTVRNPFPRAAALHVRLVGPPGWRGTEATLQAPARAEVSCDLQITPTGPCKRQPFVVELTADDQPFGQVAEALMTVGHQEF